MTRMKPIPDPSCASKCKLTVTSLMLLSQCYFIDAFTLPSVPSIGSVGCPSISSPRHPYQASYTSSTSSSPIPVPFNHAPLPFYRTPLFRQSRPSLSLHVSNAHVNESISSLPDSPDPYIILNIHPHASKGDIKRAYRQLALMYHPDIRTNISSTEEDRQRANDDFAKINAAYAFLTGKSDRPTARRTRTARRRRPKSDAKANARASSNWYGGTSSDAQAQQSRRPGVRAKKAASSNTQTPNHGVAYNTPSQAQVYAQAKAQAAAQAQAKAQVKQQQAQAAAQAYAQQQAQAQAQQKVANARYSRPGYKTSISTENNVHSQPQSTQGTTQDARYSRPGYRTNTDMQTPNASVASDVYAQAHAQAQNAQRTSPSARYSRPGYGGTSSDAHVKESEDSNPSRFSRSVGTNNVNTQPQSTRRAAPGKTYSRPAYNGVYGGTSNTHEQEKDDTNPSRFSRSVGANNVNIKANSKSQQSTRRTMPNTIYSREGFGGTSSSYTPRSAYNKKPNSKAQPSTTGTSATSKTSTSTAKQVKRTSMPNSAYSSQGYGGTSSAYPGTAGARTSKAGTSSTKSTGAKTATKKAKTHSASTYAKGVYGGTSSSYSECASSGTQSPDVEERRKSGDFFNAESFHAQYTSSNCYNGSIGTKGSQTQGYKGYGGTSTAYAHDTLNKDANSDSQSSVSSENTNNPRNEKKTSDVFDAEKFHSQWNPSTYCAVSSSGTSNPSQPKKANFNNDQFHMKWNSSNVHGTNPKVDAREEERLYNEAVIDAARRRAEELSQKLKAEEEAKAAQEHLGGFANGISMAVKSISNIFGQTPQQTQNPKDTVKVPSPATGLQFSPYEACCIIERHDKDPLLDKPKAMKLMLCNHYVPVRKPQLYAVYRLYKEGKIREENRWGQYI